LAAVQSGVTLNGRALSLGASVTLVDTVINVTGLKKDFS